MADKDITQLPIDKVLHHITTALEEWKQKQTPEVIKQQVFQKLDRGTEDILLKLLGFNRRNGDAWEIDHCNGRQGNTAAGDYLRTCHEQAIKAWFEQVQKPVMTPALKKSLEAAYKKEYGYRILRSLEDAAQERARNDAEELVDTLASSNNINNYLKTLKLLNAKTTPGN